ncbi:putative cutinase/acetylxylan esterase, alpha/Beta hydrolase [Septoria linicola]|nr:putative cutinase/acetylxylan esterase, alpha/Beta hydrolase [Septoria linicola]
MRRLDFFASTLQWHTIFAIVGLLFYTAAAASHPPMPVRNYNANYWLTVEAYEGAACNNANYKLGSQARVAGSYSHAIDYPATIIALDSNYITSVVDGIEDTKASIEAYVAACGASSRIALIGYSQGGNVMTDTLAGGTGKPAPIAEQYRQNIVGVAVFGDPRSNAGQPYSRGTSTRDGIFARDSSLPALSSWSNVLVSYCDENDLYCASGLSLDVHSATVSKYAQEAADFIIGLAQ